MKKTILLFALSIAFCHSRAQTFEGGYGQGDTAQFQIIRRPDGLVFQTEHYGNIRMLPLGGNRFTLEHVNPPIILEFFTDDAGKISLLFHQKGLFTWLRDDSSASSGPVGMYHQDIDRYAHATVREDSGRLYIDQTALIPTRQDTYRPLDTSLKDVYVFRRDKEGRVKRMVLEKDGIQVFWKKTTPVVSPGRDHIPDRALGFTRADTLEGMPSLDRTCYDVLFYDLSVSVDVAAKSLRGHNNIRFRVVRPFDSLQIDLYANLTIDSILFHGLPLSYRREFNAVFVRFPGNMPKSQVDSLEVYYRGTPSLPDGSVLAGGIIWATDKNGKPWVESVVQGSGGSVWWPCKDLLSDKPDSMRIRITVPRGLAEISNGRFLGKTELPGNLTCYDWYVSYPILNYDVVFYIGDYVPVGQYFSLSYNVDRARKVFARAPAMLDLYTKDFGPYPFPADGFKLVEAPYPMEHQEAVSMGPLNGVDNAEVARTMWHESAHEWWGNSVSCSDFADLWIHEAFATYAEVLCYQAFSGDKAARKYLQEQVPANKEPILGVYNVNYFYLGDLYSKGCLMLHTLRNVLGNDSLWFAVLRGIQARLRYQSVTTEEIVHCFNDLAGANYTCIFDQYLRNTSIPTLQWSLERNLLRYRWKADVAGFHMPVKINPGGVLLHATTEWQEVTLAQSRGFEVDTADYFVRATAM